MEWKQGNWNAFVVLDCATETESQKRLQETLAPFQEEAANHAGTFWRIQDRSKPTPLAAPWPLIEITPKHWAAGKAHLAGANRTKLKKFGDQEVGFAAEHAVADWFASKGIEHNHNPDPRNTAPDFTIGGVTVDLKSVSTVGAPQRHYDANLAEAQRKKSSPDWYLFGKHNKTTAGDYYILGFQTEDIITREGVYYSKGETTRQMMRAPVDCWCIEYWRLIKPLDWIEINGKML
jgi:hypothetical protein